MLDFYTAIIIIAILSMIVMSVHIFKSQLLDSRDRNGFLAVFEMIMVVSAAEWLGVVMNGWPSEYRLMHALVKALEFSLAPALILVWSSIIGNSRIREFTWPVIVVNGVLEFASAFRGFIFYIDEYNVYRRGEFYWIYIAFYTFGVLVLFWEILDIGRLYQNREFEVLILLFFFLAVGIIFQLVKSEIRTTWISSAITVILFYLYYVNLLLQVDSLTGLLNRTCYETHISSAKSRTAIILFDVNSFKDINDNYGHQYGDFVLKKLSNLILSTYSRRGLCYRIGGDEFCVILKKGILDQKGEGYVDALNSRFFASLDRERMTEPLLPSVAVGYAIHEEGAEISRTIDIADARMYDNKSRYKNRVKERVESEG